MKENTVDKIMEIGSRLTSLKSKSVLVKDYCDIQKEIRQVRKSIDKMQETTLFMLRQKYTEMLENQLEKLKLEEDVISYLRICEEFSTITSETSAEMKKLKKQSPELHSWIMLNKKRAIYEKLIEEDPERYDENFKILEAVKRNITVFRSQHKESVDQWEKYYHIKHLIRTFSE
ncbi:MAG: hypothetical protein IJ809_06935 [Clostridia bacterium]|nr:hypothetical protein [Clostridia bacterium]